MYTKNDFQNAIKNAFLKQELTSVLYQAGDPRLLQVLDAQATMLAMLSQQIELAMQEPFVKSRDATVLADAALKGLIFTAKPTKYRLQVVNNNAKGVTIATGRVLLDTNNRQWRVLKTVTVPAVTLAPKNTAEIIVEQVQTVTQTHTVENSQPFYAIEIEQPNDGSAIASLTVGIDGQTFTPSYKFNNVGVDELVYHIESDEQQRLFVKFGMDNVLGYQPSDGQSVIITQHLTFGNLSLKEDAPFSLQYINARAENDLKFSVKSLEESGVNPQSVAVLRELVKYPSVYDNSAVFLGEFELLLRKNYPELPFLSVWNEQREEQARGANVANVNTLFVSFQLPSGSTLTRTAVQNRIKSIIASADDTYNVKFVNPIVQKVQCAITGSISQIWDFDEVKSQIETVLLDNFGENGLQTKTHQLSVKHKAVVELLQKSINAFDDSNADFTVQITNPTNDNPEVFRYMDLGSIRVTLSNNGYASTKWSN